MKLKIGFIGAGNMAEAIISSLLNKKICCSSDIYITEPDLKRRTYMEKKYQITNAVQSDILVKECYINILSVKPQILVEVIENTFKNYLFDNNKKIIVSIAAGIKTKTIEKIIYGYSGNELKRNFPVIRVMPNTPSLAGEGMSALSCGEFAGEEEILQASKIIGATGKTTIVDEEKMDWITAVSGSGPAYFFLFLESLINAGINLGFTRKESCELVFQTAKGSLALLEKTGDLPENLRKKVTSKGGTTEAALKILIEKDFEDIIFSAVKAASDRAFELSIQ